MATDGEGQQGMRPGPFLAALASALIPGLGQAWLGHRRRGLAWFVPVVVLVAAVATGVLAARPDRTMDLLAAVLRPTVLEALLVADGLLLAYRLGAVLDAWWIAGGRAPRSGRLARTLSVGGLALIIVLAGSVHAAVGVADYEALDLVGSVFGRTGTGAAAVLPSPAASPSPRPSPVPSASPLPSLGPAGTIPGWRLPAAADPTPIPTPSPSPAPPLPTWARNGRLDLLLVGSDAGPDRWLLRTDTMILLSVDIRTGRAALFGIPRNLIDVPLPAETAKLFDCGCYPYLLNSLWVYADQRPDQFPGGGYRGWRALAGAIATLTGVDLDGLAVVDLNGFVRLIDAIGGLKLYVPAPLYDADYPKPDGSGTMVLSISAGWHHFDGAMALAYARSRHQDSDYGRMARQQQVLLALRAQLQPCRLLTKLPSLLPAIKQSLWTTLSIDDLPALIELASRVDVHAIQRDAFTPPTYPETLRAADVARIRSLVAHVFDGTTPTPSETPIEVLPDGC